MKNLDIFKNTLYVFLLISAAGCKKLIEIPASAPNQIVTTRVFADSISAVNGVIGIYTNNFGNLGVLSGSLTIYPSMSSDELIGTDGSAEPFYDNALIAGNSTAPGGSSSNIWDGSYTSTLVYQLNACIEGLTASATLTPTLKNQLIGECEVVRALVYFNLTNIFGATPIAKTTDYLANSKLARSPQDSVYAFIENDLVDAANRLPVVYASSGRARPNKYTALALLSKVYLYTKQYSKAESQASLIINSGEYGLEKNLNNVFLDGSNEAIWQAPGVGFSTYATLEGSELIPYENDIIPFYYLNNYLLSAFESGDQRKVQWIGNQTVDGTTYYYPFKYQNTSSFPSVNGTTEDYMIFRLAEQYLIRAEARVEQGNLNGGVEDLNIIRQRAGLPNSIYSTQTDLINAVLHERQTEMFCEWGNRWFDLKRMGVANAILSLEKPGVWPTDGHAALYPVPLDQVRLDQNLKQNPGY
jgi:hypothetical protein